MVRLWTEVPAAGHRSQIRSQGSLRDGPSVSSARENRGGCGAGSTVDLGVADAGVTLDLAVARQAAELEHQLVDLAEAGGSDWFTVGDESTVGVDRHWARDLGRSVGEKLLLVAVSTEPVLSHVDDLSTGIGVLNLDHVNVLGPNPSFFVDGAGRVHGGRNVFL